MPTAYTAEAIEDCFQLYLRFNGQQHDRIQGEMQKTWPTWSKQNLYTRGDKVGWIERYGWAEALKRKIDAAAKAGATTSAESLFLEIENRRKQIDSKLDAEGCDNRDLVYQHQKYCDLSISALARLESARDNLANFVTAWEHLMEWLPEINQEATKALLAVHEEVLSRAEKEYGS